MSAIDTSDWGEFRVDDLFTMVKGTRLTSAQRKPGDIPYVGASMFDNGMTERIGNDERLHPAGVLTVCYNGPVGTTFYQPEDFWATDDVNVLYPKFEMSIDSALFIAPMIQAAGAAYAYIDKWKMEDMAAAVIRLPIVTDGEPDWLLVESTMREVLCERETALDKLTSLAKSSGHAMATDSWVEFLLSDLFERIESGRCSNIGVLSDGNIPYIAASVSNNGYVRHVDDVDGSFVSDGNCIAMIVDGNGGLGRNTYQAEPFVGSSNLQLGYHSRLSQWNALFLIACLDKSVERYNYNFAWKRRGEAFKGETVFLPATTDGGPDWGYMELTMREIMTEREAALDCLQSLVGPV